MIDSFGRFVLLSTECNDMSSGLTFSYTLSLNLVSLDGFVATGRFYIYWLVVWNIFPIYQLEPHKAVAEVSKIGNL